MRTHARAARTDARTATRGLTLVELSVGLGVAAFALASVALTLQGDARSLGAGPSSSFQEQAVRDLVAAVALELEGASAAAAVSALEAPLSIVEADALRLADASLFPASGVLVLSPGRATEERLLYADLDPETGRARIVRRGLASTAPSAHARGARAAWSSAATGDARTGHRADGSGFSYRPGSAGGRGAVAGAGACLYFEPVAAITEAARGFDYNRDGDLDDAFDVGRIRRRLWAPDGEGVDDRPLSTPIVLQERGARGADLDGDGSEDPLFEWQPEARRLRFSFDAIVGGASSREVVARRETWLRLAGGAAD